MKVKTVTVIHRVEPPRMNLTLCGLRLKENIWWSTGNIHWSCKNCLKKRRKEKGK